MWWERGRNLFERSKTYSIVCWQRMRTQYNDLPRKRQDLVRLGLLGLVLLLLAVWNMALPKLSDIDDMYARGDAAGLCRYIERHGQTDRWNLVMRGAAKAVLDLGEVEAIARLDQMIGDSRLSVPVRIAIVDQFGEHQLLVPELFVYIPAGEISPDLRQALINAANKVDGNVFETQVDKELETARLLAATTCDAALRQAEHARLYDVNGLRTGRINSTEYAIYAYQLRRVSFPNDSEKIKSVLEQMLALDCSERLREEEHVAGMIRLIGEYERLNHKLQDQESGTAYAKRNVRRLEQQEKLRRVISLDIKYFSEVDRGIVSRK